MLQVLNDADVVVYLDDVTCLHFSFDEHLKSIQRLLQKFRKSGFKLLGMQELPGRHKISQVPWSRH